MPLGSVPWFKFCSLVQVLFPGSSSVPWFKFSSLVQVLFLGSSSVRWFKFSSLVQVQFLGSSPVPWFKFSSLVQVLFHGSSSVLKYRICLDKADYLDPDKYWFKGTSDEILSDLHFLQSDMSDSQLYQLNLYQSNHVKISSYFCENIFLCYILNEKKNTLKTEKQECLCPFAQTINLQDKQLLQNFRKLRYCQVWFNFSGLSILSIIRTTGYYGRNMCNQ